MQSPVVGAVKSETNQFYPTPEHVVRKMCQCIDWKNVHNMLEPSAGKGNIVSYVSEHYIKQDIISCVELNADLCKILREDGYSVYNGDFMRYTSAVHFDCVMMNPPFNVAVQHLVKVLRMVIPHGGQVVCLMNADTLTHLQNSNIGKELYDYIQQYNAHIETFDAAFVESERPTYVHTAMLYFNIPQHKQSDIFANIVKAVEIQDATMQNTQTAIEMNDIIKSLVKQYNIEVNCGLKLIAEYKELAPKMLCDLRKDLHYNSQILELTINRKEVSETRYVEATRLKYWKYLLGSGEFTKLFTQKLIDEYYNQLHAFRAYDFTLENIYQVRLDMQSKLTQSLQDSILDMFERLTFKNSMDCASNIHYYNGWRTNDAFKINKRVVYPYANGYDEWYNQFSIRYDFQKFLIDLEHVFDYLGGTAPDSCSVRHFEGRLDTFKNIPFKYFRVTLYKKGTAHIEFTSELLVKKLNLYGAMRKGWLPNCYGKTAYKNMNTEERAVIDSFEGEQAYMKNMTDAESRNFLLNMPAQVPMPQLLG